MDKSALGWRRAQPAQGRYAGGLWDFTFKTA
jgi:hypothetical protein